MTATKRRTREWAQDGMEIVGLRDYFTSSDKRKSKISKVYVDDSGRENFLSFLLPPEALFVRCSHSHPRTFSISWKQWYVHTYA
jgi:hypothetical protein